MTDSTREASGLSSRLMARSERYAPAIFLMPTVLVVLFASIFPLIVSLYLSLSRFRFVKGGFELKFVGFRNYNKLLLGSQQLHFLGRFGELFLPGWVGVVVVGVGAAVAPMAGGTCINGYKNLSTVVVDAATRLQG